MRLILETTKSGEKIAARVLLLNDSFAPIEIDRRLLVGPNVRPQTFTGIPYPVAVEPLPAELMTLNPWCLYGRERSFEHLPPGPSTFYAYLLKAPTDALLPEGPADPSLLLLSAEPVVVAVQ